MKSDNVAPYKLDKTTPVDSYLDGYETGQRWKDTYFPGGPHVHKSTHLRSDPDWIAYCELSQIKHDAWKRGFWDALPENSPVRALYTPKVLDAVTQAALVARVMKMPEPKHEPTAQTHAKVAIGLIIRSFMDGDTTSTIIARLNQAGYRIEKC